MSDGADIGGGQSPRDPGADEELTRLARRLSEERPVPSAMFRADLRRTLLTRARQLPSAPSQLRPAILAYAVAGVALLLVAAVGVAGAGPFAA